MIEWVLSHMVHKVEQSCLPLMCQVQWQKAWVREWGSPGSWLCCSIDGHTSILFPQASKCKVKVICIWGTSFQERKRNESWAIIMPQLGSGWECPLPDCLPWLLLEDFLVGSLNLTEDEAALYETVKKFRAIVSQGEWLSLLCLYPSCSSCL